MRFEKTIKNVWITNLWASAQFLFHRNIDRSERTMGGKRIGLWPCIMKRQHTWIFLKVWKGSLSKLHNSSQLTSHIPKHKRRRNQSSFVCPDSLGCIHITRAPYEVRQRTVFCHIFLQMKLVSSIKDFLGELAYTFVRSSIFLYHRKRRYAVWIRCHPARASFSMYRKLDSCESHRHQFIIKNSARTIWVKGNFRLSLIQHKLVWAIYRSSELNGSKLRAIKEP